MSLLREDLLAGQTIAVGGSVRAAVRASLSAAGASLVQWPAELDEDSGAGWASAQAPLPALVYDAGEDFGAGGADGLNAALERVWVAARAVATGAQIPGDGGKIVLIAPGPAGEYAQAARAGLENLARTLSVEWARHLITVTAIASGANTTGEQLGALVSFLASPAGDYFSGCRFDLSG